MREISKQKRAEDAYLISQRKLDLIQAGAGYWIWDSLSKSLFLSESITGSLGFAVEDSVQASKPLESRVHPEDKEIAESFFGRLEGGPRAEKEVIFRIRCADDLFVKVVIRGGTELGVGESGHFVGAIFRVDEKREAFLDSSISIASEVPTAESSKAE